MAFFFDTNNQATIYGASLMFKLKEVMKLAGWTVMASSDGTTYNASGDQITTATTGAGGMNNSLAWFRIRMPTLNSVTREFLFQRNSTAENATVISFRIKYSYSAGFTVGTPTITATSAPAATDQVFIFGSGADTAPLSTQVDGVTTVQLFQQISSTYHVCAGDSSEGYMFYWVANPAGGVQAGYSSPTSGMILEPMLSGTYPTEDVEPFIIHCAATLGAPTTKCFVFNGLSIGAAADVSGTWTHGWMKKGLVGEAFKSLIGSVYMENSIVPKAAGNQILGTNPYTTKDDLLPIPYARKTNTSVNTASGGPYGWKGLGRHMYWLMSADRANGDTFTVSTTRDRIIYGDVSLPWDGSVPTI